MYFPSKFGCYPDKPKKKKKFKAKKKKGKQIKRRPRLLRRRRNFSKRRIIKKLQNLHQSRYKNKIAAVGTVMKKVISQMNVQNK